MSRKGLIGLAAIAILMMLATPVMAAPTQTNNVTLNTSGLYLYDFDVTPRSGDAPLIVYINASLNNTAATDLWGYIVLWVNDKPVNISDAGNAYGAAENSTLKTITIDNKPVRVINVTVANNTKGDDLGWVNFTYTFDYAGNYNIAPGNDTSCLSYKTVTVDPESITLSPLNGTVGTTVTFTAKLFSPPGSPVTVYFSTPTEDIIVNKTSTDSGGNFTATFEVPDVPAGTYNVTAKDSRGYNKTVEFTVLPVPAEKTLEDLGITDLSLNKTVLRSNDAIRMDVAVNKSKLQNLDVKIVIINKTAWSNISKDINDGKPVANSTIWNNATKKWDVSDSFVAIVSNLPANDYYVVAYNNSSVQGYVDMYNVTATLTVKPSPQSVNLSDLGINEAWSVKGGELNVSDVDYGKTVKIPINATQEVNLAIVESDTWNKLYANISTLTKDEVFSKAKWYKENFKNNKNETLEISTADCGITPGTYRIVVFNTTDSYIHYYNNSTIFNVYPVPTATTWDKLGIDDFKINRTTMRFDEALKIVLIRSENVKISVAILNETTWDNIVKNYIEKGKNVTNSTIMNNATSPYGWNKTTTSDFVEYVSNLLPDKYVIVIYNVTSIGTDYVNLYNVSASFEVTLKPKKVNLADLNITNLELDKTTVNYGDSFNLTVNVTGTANFNIAILNETAWSELKQLSGIPNATILSKAKWNKTNVNANDTWPIPTTNALLPNNYVVVVYNTTTVSNVLYVNWYNDDVTFSVVSVTNKVDFADLGIVTMYLNKSKVVYGGSIKLTVDWNESVTTPVNIAILNETEWNDILSVTPTNSSVLAVDEWNKTNVASDLIQLITASFKPDKYVVVVYNEENGAITNYNDDLRFEVYFKAKNVNLTNLVNASDVTPKEVTVGDSIVLEVAYKQGVNVSVAILSKDDWNALKAEESILNETLLSKAVWKKVNITRDCVETISTADWNAGTYVVVIYNTSQDYTKYVNWYNDSITFEVVSPVLPDLTVESINVTPESPVVNETVTVKAKIANVGDADAEAFNVGLYANDSLVDTKTVESLTAGNSTTVEFSWTPTEAKTYVLKVVADVDNAVDESNETNNEMTTTVTVTVGEIVPDNVPDELEQIVTKYYPEFDWRKETPTKEIVVQAVTNAVQKYFMTTNVTLKQQIVNDVTNLVTLYFQYLT